jgi:radical SAM protein with 4Fe4S-binding SPASM domain
MESKEQKTEAQNAENSFKEIIGNSYGRDLLNDRFDRVRAILAGKNPAPYEIEIQPAARCNANCRWCFGAEYKRCEDKLYTPEAMEHVINEVLNFENDGFEIDLVKFCGSTGEPLLNPYTMPAIDMMAGKKYVRLFTNGFEVGSHKNDPQYLATLGKLNRINASLDAISDETLYAAKPGARKSNASMEDILLGLARIKEFGTSIEAGFAITGYNYNEIAEFARKIKQYKSAERVRYRIDVTDRSIAEHAEEILAKLKEAKEYEDQDFKVIQIHSEDFIRETNPEAFGSKGCGYKCFTSNFWSCIGPDGKVYPCGHIVSRETPSYGDLFEKSLKEIWNSQERKDLQKSLPNEWCHLCSPFSLTTNSIGDWISKQNIRPEQLEDFHERYIVEPKRCKCEKVA